MLLRMGRKELEDPDTADWEIRGSHAVAPVRNVISPAIRLSLTLDFSVSTRWCLSPLPSRIEQTRLRIFATFPNAPVYSKDQAFRHRARGCRLFIYCHSQRTSIASC